MCGINVNRCIRVFLCIDNGVVTGHRFVGGIAEFILPEDEAAGFAALKAFVVYFTASGDDFRRAVFFTELCSAEQYHAIHRDDHAEAECRNGLHAGSSLRVTTAIT